MQKQVHFRIKGMQRDLSASAFSPEYAYENRNIRIMSTDESTLLSLINEKGNKKSNIAGVGDHIEGIPIGQALVNNELIIFTAGDDDYRLADITPDIFEAPDIFSCDTLITDLTAGEDTANDITPDLNSIGDITFIDYPYKSNIDVDSMLDDRIYKLWFDNGALTGKRLFRGDLGFNYKHPIETISFYENTDIRKVYWTDGLNQPRVINIAAASDVVSKWNTDSFNFVRTLNLNEVVTIERNIAANGSFASGVIQYAFTYVNSYAQESNIFYTSPLYYVSYNNRGASPEDKVGNSFNIIIDGVDKNFEYVRVYSIHRTSIDAIPTTKRVVDLAISIPGRYRVPYVAGVYNTESILALNVTSGSYISLTLIPSESTDPISIWSLKSSEYSQISLPGGNIVYIEEGKVLKITVSDPGIMGQTRVYYQGNLLDDPTTYILVDDYSKSKVTYTDTGEAGDVIDPTELLYVGGEEIVGGTIAQKDNTLFLGDVTLKRRLISSSVKDYCQSLNPTFSDIGKALDSPDVSGYYPYDNQLKLSSNQIKTFKYLETYRLGVQFQHYTGKWSEPIWVKDVRNTVHIDSGYSSKEIINLIQADVIFKNKSIISELVDQGYIRVRPVIVFPSLYERECVCQGILCPTVYNVSDRYNNSPFAQSSWFVRANAPFDEDKAFNYILQDGGNYSADTNDRNTGTLVNFVNSRAGIMYNGKGELHSAADYNVTVTVDTVNKGAWAEFRHDHPIPSNNDRKAEIQCIYNPPAIPYVSSELTSPKVSEWVSENQENFYVDQSILTFHSPDIEFDTDVRNLDGSNLKLRIVGFVPLTSFVGDIDIQTSTPPLNYKGRDVIAMGFYKEPIGVENISRFGYRGIMSGAFWMDEINGALTDNPSLSPTGFVVYPFHRNGSLNNTKDATEGYRSAMLDKKKLSNLRFSLNSYYFNTSDIWYAYEANSTTKTGISGVSIFDSNEQTLIRIPAPENSGLNEINYYGNVDKIISYPRVGDKKDGYPIVTTSHRGSANNLHSIFSADYAVLPSGDQNPHTGIDPVSMKYKSSPHAVLALNYTSNHAVRILPTLFDGDVGSGGNNWRINNQSGSIDGLKPFWSDSNVTRVSQDVLNVQIPIIKNGSKSGYGPEFGWLWLAELYNDNVQNRFGGQTEEAFENNQWVPGGEPVSLIDSDGIIKNIVYIHWTEGDTYYQRYDHLKTYPFTLEDQNAITDIISFMCETRVNLDGRYDRNRGQISNFAMTPTNFNLMNDVYSQTNNFFSHRGVNSKRLNLDNFHNVITWTKTKTAGELVDSWTNVTLASTLDLDGDKGSVRAIRRFNNNLIAFQDKGISQILYNEQTQITSTEGVPIEIANSGKVNGKRYISDKVGCSNKWSICETPNGIYFIDDITKGIFLFNGQLDNISDRLGFHSWINAKSTGINIWDPVDFNGFVTYYDKVNGDVFFISKDECLAFSEPLGQFSSFYSYEKMPYFTNLEDRGIALNVEGTGTLYRPWLHNEGDYNMFFGVYQPFSTTIIANPDMPLDKIFNTLEFRADSWSGNSLLNTTFDTLTTWNEYQSGTSTLNNVIGRPSTLKKKFRIWRANLPRDRSNNRDRMRNPWLYIKLSMEAQNTNKTLLHDMVVHYFE